jgi:hypothetical protein
MKKTLLCVSLVAFFAMSSCSMLDTLFKKVTIQDVSWYFETIAPDRWSDSVVDKPSLSYSFEVYFQEELDASDIKTARIYLPNSSSYWTLDPETTLDTERKSIGYGVRYWLGSNNDELPIGTLTAEIVLTNDRSSRYTFTMGRPGSTSPDNYNYVYSSQEEATPTNPATSTPALMRPVVTKLEIGTGGHIETTFEVRGNNVRNGWVWFYDSENQYIGRSPYFYDQKNGTYPYFSKGYFDTVANAENTLKASQYEIKKSNGNVLTYDELCQIKHCRLFVTDGAQYVGQGVVQYDYRAMSPYF